VKKGENFAVFIDSSNLYYTTKALGWKIDYKLLLNFFEERGDLLRPYLYTTTIPEGEDRGRPLTDWLQYNGYTVNSKPVKTYSNPQGTKISKGNMDVELAVDALEMATTQKLQRIVIMSGDGDFTYLVKAIQKKGVRVTIISTRKTQPSFAADELIRTADEFIDLVDIRPQIENKRQATIALVGK